MLKKQMKGIAILTAIGTGQAVLLYSLATEPILLTLSITLGTFFYHIAMRLLVGLSYDALFHNRMNLSMRWFQQPRFEGKLYQVLRVKQWKSKMPTYQPDVFSFEQHTPQEVAMAMCQAELVHETIVVLSFAPLIAVRWFGAFPVFFITSILAAAFDLSFVIMQRYNRPRVLRLRAKSKMQN